MSGRAATTFMSVFLHKGLLDPAHRISDRFVQSLPREAMLAWSGHDGHGVPRRGCGKHCPHIDLIGFIVGEDDAGRRRAHGESRYVVLVADIALITKAKWQPAPLSGQPARHANESWPAWVFGAFGKDWSPEDESGDAGIVARRLQGDSGAGAVAKDHDPFEAVTTERVNHSVKILSAA